MAINGPLRKMSSPFRLWAGSSRTHNTPPHKLWTLLNCSKKKARITRSLRTARKSLNRPRTLVVSRSRSCSKLHMHSSFPSSPKCTPPGKYYTIFHDHYHPKNTNRLVIVWCGLRYCGSSSRTTPKFKGAGSGRSSRLTLAHTV